MRAWILLSVAGIFGIATPCGAAAAEADWVAPLEKADWTAQPTWLGNPAGEGEHSVDRGAATTVFRVDEPGRGMKWSWQLGEPLSLLEHRYLAIRYRSTGQSPRGDYALCVLGTSPEGKSGYRCAIGNRELDSDGRWHTLNVDLAPIAAGFPTVTALAVQVQAAAPGATLEIGDLRLTNTRQPSRLADAVDWQPEANFEDFAAVPMAAAVNAKSEAWQRELRLDRWFDTPAVTAEDIPFRLAEGAQDLAATPLAGKSELSFPCDQPATEVYVLLLVTMTGDEEPAYGTGRLRAIRDVDRFRLRLEYADGMADECLPMNVFTKGFGVGEGVQVVVAAADGDRRLRGIVLHDIARQAAFAVAAVTLRTDGKRAFPEALEDSPPLRLRAASPLATPESTAGRWIEAEIADDGPPLLRTLVRRPTGWSLLEKPCPLVRLTVDGKPIPIEGLQRIAAAKQPASDSEPRFSVAQVPGLQLGLDIKPHGDDGLAIRASIHNGTKETHRIGLVAPAIGPYRLCEQANEAFYLVPNRGAAFDNRPCAYRERYCGLFPVQFVDTFSPAHGRGLTLRTTDTSCLRKRYLLDKSGGAFSVGIDYPGVVLGAGQSFESATAIVQLTDGDWHAGFEAYRRWVQSWHKPLSPRKPWFREIFNFRQRFLHWLDPLYDAESGKLDLLRAVDEAQDGFGGIDYLHLFDWGNVPGVGRIYGRTGDLSPYDYLRGGREALRRAITGVQAKGVPTGLYIEGYLLQEKGNLGREHGKDWQLIGADGHGLYWPGSTEMFVCPAVEAWREVQTSTYAAKVRELGVDGMYLDQFGFAGAGKDCYSPDHGHAVPSYAVVTERDCTRLVREAMDRVRPGVALYTEETPVDVTTQYQDGSFTYAMFSAQRTQTRVPLNVARFAFPDFKTIEILFCDKPTGSWATGVRWVFFNGEGIWLEGPADEWFEPETRAAIHRCYGILRKHHDAFTTLKPVPLVPTQLGGVYANAFPTEGETVYTLYNSRHRTVRGEVLRIPHRRGTTYHDAWHDRPAEFRLDGPDAVITLEIGPHGVGCVVAQAN